MSVKAWIVITQEQFDSCKTVWPNNECRPDYWTKLQLGNSWINKYPTADGALEEARTSLEEWPEDREDLQLLVCGVEFDDVTCINALNCVQYGDSLGSHHVICKEYLYYPSKAPV